MLETDRQAVQTDRQADTPTDRQTNRRTDGQTDRQASMQAGRHTHTERERERERESQAKTFFLFVELTTYEGGSGSTVRCYIKINRHDRLLNYILLERATFLHYNDTKPIPKRNK